MPPMSTIAASPPRLYTPDDLLRMPEGDRYELVDGRLVELNMSSKSQFVGTRLARFLGNYCEPAGLAYVIVENGYTCFPGKPNKMRKPDVSCIRSDRIAFEEIGEGYISIPPDLAVEVVSPNDRVVDLEEKLDDYHDAGIPLVWIIYPSTRKVRIIRPDRPTVDLGPDDELTGEDILPGFRCRIADLFVGLPAPQIGPPG
jgi:Uma2 family endonuclease